MRPITWASKMDAIKKYFFFDRSQRLWLLLPKIREEKEHFISLPKNGMTEKHRIIKIDEHREAYCLQAEQINRGGGKQKMS